ncbi:DMT family transporter [Pseudoflavonifractor phocaeensis]|uniref:DMT family transporter n=1 Tax=Pseudoflavonifractor phocaeensis TaxID=1870988 RepID=UPI001DF5E7AF|nr:DMT family transporter [Pseudoflavonifractor phocaeensis]MBM6937931.1 DMT family transporter [Pseudoflavonifractor phocaeensis]
MAEQKDKETGKSLLSLHAAVMLFGLSSVLGRFVDAPAAAVAGGRVVCSSLALLLLALVRKEPLRLRTSGDRKLAIFAGLVLAIHWTTFFQSIQTASVAIGTITFSTFPLFLTFLEPLIFREPLRLRNLGTAALLLAGIFITVPEFSVENRTTVGILWGLVCSLAYAVLSLANRRLSRRYPARTICLYEQGTAAAALLPFLLFTPVQWTPRTVAGIAAIGFLCTAFAHSLYVSAQRKVSAQTAGIISGLETVYGILYALLFLGEVPSLREIAGGLVILGAALAASLRPAKERPQHAA